MRKAAAFLADDARAVSLGRAWDVLDPLLIEIAAACPDVQALEPAGGVRRAEPIVTGLSIAGRATVPSSAIDAIAALPLVTEILYRTTRRLVLTVQGHEIDVRIATPDEYGTLLFVVTGPAAHVAAVQKRRGVRLAASETEVYTHAGLAYLPPQVRHTAEAM